MEVVSLRASQLTQQIYSSSVLRLFVAQQQQQILAFCTLLTVALSLLFYSRRLHLTHYNYNFTRCLNCLIIRPSRIRLSIRTRILPLNLKLKRLRTLTSATKSTTVYYTSVLLRPLNKMRKETKLRVKNIINIKSGMSMSSASFSSYNKRTNNSTSAAIESTQSLYCQACENNDVPKITASKSYPMFVPNSMRRNGNSQPRINSSKVVLYRKLPLRSMSRAWGEINSIDLPTWCRKPCYYFYSWMFSCNLDEIDIDDLNQYKNLSEFFRRALKPDARIIHHSLLVSPCDGKILHFGQVEKGMLEQVKGVNYALQAFLGDQTWPKNTVKKPTTSRSRYSLSSSSSSSDDEVRSISSNLSDSGISDDGSNSGESPEAYEKSILYHPEENCLYHCVIYLAPGDYHRFHSPTDWQVFARRHFPGELFSVNPSVARWLQGLFNFNERVVYYGEWQHGFFSMTAVGATNVGSIRVYMDDGMTTNKKAKNLDESDLEKNFSKFDTQSDSIKGVEIKKGENFGEFNLGSTIVLIFEAPKDFKFDVNQSEKVFFGCKLGGSPSYPDRDEQTKL